LGHALHRNAGYHRNHFGDILFTHFSVGGVLFVVPAFLARLEIAQELFLAVAQDGRLFEILGAHHLVLFGADAFDLLFQIADVARDDDIGEVDAGAGLIEDIDGLVGLKAVGDVTIRELDDIANRLFGIADAVMRLIAALQPLDDGESLIEAGGIDDHFLEPAFEGAVFLDVLAELVEGGGADALEFAAR